MTANDSERSKPTERERPVDRSVIYPSQLLTLFSDDEWEDFITEWAESLGEVYKLIERRGGAGDKGRDVVCYLGDDRATCDIDVYQCKHYGHPIQPNEIWTELGKLCHFTMNGDFRVPRHYRLVAPQGVGSTLADLFDKPDALRAGLLANWKKHCESKITQETSLPLAGPLKTYVEQFDFGIVGYVPVGDLLEQHKRTTHWYRRFKQEPPTRPKPDPVPKQIQRNELRYVGQLLAAYGERARRVFVHVEDLAADTRLLAHFERCRLDYFMADSLNRFYRDGFPAGAFEHIKDQVHAGVIDTAEGDYKDGLERISATLEQAVRVQLAANEYTPFVEPGDRKGVCHHLAGEDRLTWVRNA